MPFNHTILPDLIRRAGLTQTEAARRIGTSQPRLSEICRGRRTDHIDLATVERIASVLGVRVQDLIK